MIQRYPVWHPLVSHAHDCRMPRTYPARESGYHGLDHTILFRDGFLTCPYNSNDKVLESVERISREMRFGSIEAREVQDELYASNTRPVLVKCYWGSGHKTNQGTVRKSVAVGLMLEAEVPCWRDAELGETWKTMQPYLLGSPHGGRSSLFVDEEAGQALKKVWEAIIATGMYGPLRLD